MSFEKQEVISTHFYASHVFQLQSQPALVKRCLLLTDILVHEQFVLISTTFGRCTGFAIWFRIIIL